MRRGPSAQAWPFLLLALAGGASAGFSGLCFKPGDFPPNVDKEIAPRPFPLVCSTPSSAHFRMDARKVVSDGLDKDAIVMDIISQGPVAWSISRFNQGDFAPRLGPKWEASQSNLGTNAPPGGSSLDYAAAHASQAWRPSHDFGVVIPTVAKNGEDWGDGPFYGTAAISSESGGFGYSMVDGTFGHGDCDVIVGKAGEGKEANINVAVAWVPYSVGFPSGFVAAPRRGRRAEWFSNLSHSPLLPDAAEQAVEWHWGPMAGPGGNRTVVTLPGYNAQDGMFFATATDGGIHDNDLNIVSVMPTEDDSGWQVQVHEDFDPTRFQLAPMSEWMFSFLFVPFDGVENLNAVHVDGLTGWARRRVGDVEVGRVSKGRYWLRIPGRGPLDGVWILQCAAQHRVAWGTLNAFLSYEWQEEIAAFVVEVRHTSAKVPPRDGRRPKSDPDELSKRFPQSDADFFALWMDHRQPPSMKGDSTLHAALSGEASLHRAGERIAAAGGAPRASSSEDHTQGSHNFTTGFFAGITTAVCGFMMVQAIRCSGRHGQAARGIFGNPVGDVHRIVAPL